jgi:hypothetical protein
MVRESSEVFLFTFEIDGRGLLIYLLKIEAEQFHPILARFAEAQPVVQAR